MGKKRTDLPEITDGKKFSDYSFTWKDEYALPYESQWGRIAKFCFLNGLSWSSVIHDANIKNAICADIPHWSYINIPIAQSPYIKTIAGKRKLNVTKMCPECMKYGFHSSLHETIGMNHCFIHKCELIKIPADRFYQSEQGTYEFFDVKVENIIRNEDIKNKLLEYAEKIAANNICSNNLISFTYDHCYKQIKFFDSTERLYQRLVLLQDNIELYGCKQIALLYSHDVDDEKKRIIENGVQNHMRNITELDCMSRVLREKSYNDAMEFCIDVCYKRKSGGKYAFERDMFGLCFIDIISRIIRKSFKDLHEWEEIANLVHQTRESLEYYALNWEDYVACDYEDYYIRGYIFDSWKYQALQNAKEDIYKLAVIIAYQAITDSFSTESLTEENSSRWGERNFHVDFSIFTDDIIDEPEYIIYPIIEDLLQHMINQACSMIETGVIKPGYENLIKLKRKIWSIPQYVILNYNNKVEVYRCDPD